MLVPNTIKGVFYGVPEAIKGLATIDLSQFTEGFGHMAKGVANIAGFAAELIGIHYIFDYLVLGAEEAQHMIEGFSIALTGMGMPETAALMISSPMLEVVGFGMLLAVGASLLYGLAQRMVDYGEERHR